MHMAQIDVQCHSFSIVFSVFKFVVIPWFYDVVDAKKLFASIDFGCPPYLMSLLKALRSMVIRVFW
jgi:hypothetical protein